MRALLLGPDGRLRLIWRAVLFFVLAYWLLPFALDPLWRFIAARLQVAADFTAANIGLQELENLLVALIGTAIFALYEQRRIDSYGLPLAQCFGIFTAEGLLAGLIMAAAVAAGMYFLGGMQVRGFANNGTGLAIAALAWLAANLCVGIAEEMWFRGYLLQTLSKSIGFWPASVVISLLFTADHYFFKTGENIWDVITLMSLSLLLCYSVRKTGTLWFAVGFHVAFDYMQLFVIGTPNGARIPQGRLLDSSFEGPAWLTGGVLGTEASFLMYPAIALLWLYLWRRYRYSQLPIKMNGAQ
jgi:membrane protease YdiL (CAAX protease family)